MAKNRIKIRSQIQCRVHIVDILLVEPLPQLLQRLTEALEVDDLPLPEEFDDIIDIRVIREPQDIIIRHPGLLLCCNHIRTTCD